jgi:hypothetical protein
MKFTPKSFVRGKLGRSFLIALLMLGLAVFSSAGANAPGRREALGPSNRRTPLVISEIHFAPAPRPDGRNLEFLEIYNSEPWPRDLGGYRLTGAIEFTFPPGTRLASNAFVVVAKVPADLQAVHGITQVLGPYAQDLADDSATLRLEHRNGGVLWVVKYSNEPPWPAAVSAGHSLVLLRPSLGEGDPRSWSASVRIGGSPGTFEPPADDPLRAVRINELLAKGPPGTPDFVELFNSSPSPIDVSGCILTDDPSLNRCVFPAGTTIAPGGFVAFEETRLGFGLSRSGETLYLFNPDRTMVLDAVRFGPQAEGVADGRFPDGGESFRPLVRPTAGTANRDVRVSDVVINEIMYDPISGEEDDEYVELRNRGSSLADVSGWRFVDGIDFEFPSNTVIAARGYLVVARNTARLLTNYAHLNSSDTVGDFRGALADGGERLALARADGVVVDEVTYSTGGRWGEWAHGGGSSLELIDPRGDHTLAANWADSDESAKAPWTPVEITGRLVNNGSGFSYPVDMLHVILLGAGECWIDNIEVFKAGQPNLVTNAKFQAGLAGWTGQGNHQHASLESFGYDDASCLRLRATGRGDPGPNRLLTRLSQSLRLGDAVTLRAQVRWLRGSPEILVRLMDNYLEAYGRLRVPANLGTPGQPNSRSIANAGPAIADVQHHPVLPAGGEPIKVTARVHDPDGLAGVTLRYRLDPQTNWLTTPMRDDGTDGDLNAGDGVFSGLIPGPTASTMVTFQVEADDAGSPPAGARFPSGAPARECLVRVGEKEVSNQFGAYRVWMTRQTLDTWKNRQAASSDPLDITFVYDDSRVVYNVGATYAGSKFISQFLDSPIGNPCDYVLIFPDDDRLLGATELRLIWPGSVINYLDDSLQSEQSAFWLAEQMRLPFNHRRYVQFFVNGVRRGALMEDSQKPNGDYLEEWYPNAPDGELYKLQFHVEAEASGRTGEGALARALLKYNTPTNTPPETAYRWTWNKRAVRGANNDFRSVFDLLDAFNRKDDQGFTTQVMALVDIDQWMRTFAVERAVGNWDSFGYANDQNMYFYKPPHGRWQLCIWDMDMPMGTAGAYPPADDILSSGNVSVPESRFLKHPPFCRSYLRALQEVMNGPAQQIAPLLTAKAEAFAANDIQAASPQGIRNYLAARTSSINKQLERFRAPFALSSPVQQESREPQVEITGTASFEVEALLVNGAKLPVVWTTVTNWSVTVPLTAPTNRLVVTGRDSTGKTMPDATVAVTAIYLGATPESDPPLYLNEWMAANTRTVADADAGRYADWFELYNPGEVAVDLFGYRLTDDPTNAVKFVIPRGWTIPARGYLLVWADEESHRNLTGTNLHVNFKLSRDGERIALHRPDGSLADAVEFGPQANDVSQGRWPDGAGGSFSSFTVPTPGSANGDTQRPFRITSIDLTGRDELVLTWTAIPGSSLHLQRATSLSDRDWQDVPDSEGMNTLRLSPTNTAGFFRLIMR